MVIIDREGGSYDWGNSGLLMFHKGDLPSGKKGGKAKMLFIWIDLESDGPFFWWFAGRTFLSNNFVTTCFQVPIIPCGRLPHARKLDMSAPTTAQSSSSKLVGEKRARQPKKSFASDKCIYLISLDDTTYTTATLQETRWHHAPLTCGKD
jgi:hypothetical protein